MNLKHNMTKTKGILKELEDGMKLNSVKEAR